MSTVEKKDKEKEKKALVEEDKGEYFDKGEFPGFIQSEFDRYWATLGAQKTKFLSQLAQNVSFKIKLAKVIQGLDDIDSDIDESQLTNDGIDEEKEYQFHDISTTQWNVLQQLVSDVTAAENKAKDAVMNAPKGGLPENEFAELRKNVNDKNIRRYFYAAKVYLRMTRRDFDRADWATLRDVVDACGHRTLISIPNSAKTLGSGVT